MGLSTNKGESEMETKPLSELNRGRVRVAIWTNTTKDGTLYGVTVGRLYKDGESWKTSEKLSERDLLLAAKAFDISQAWLIEHVRREEE